MWSQKARGRQLYSAMYDRVKEIGPPRGRLRFRLYVETENDRAQRVYEKVGMQKSHYLMFEEEV
jgi:RimJ/RimL family protein N-acetyltransferase